MTTTYEWTFAIDGETFDRGTTTDPAELASAKDAAHDATEGNPAPGTTYRLEVLDADGEVVESDEWECPAKPGDIHETIRDVCGDSYADLAGRIGTTGLDALAEALAAVDERFASEDETTTEHWSGALMLAYGDSTLEQLTRERRAALDAYKVTMARLQGAMVYAATNGVTEAEIVRVTGLNRGTVRKALGL